MTSLKIRHLKELFTKWSGEKVQQISQLPVSGSDREYYRIKGRVNQAIGVYNDNKKENIAFISFTRHFIKKELPVPELLAKNVHDDVYLLQDLGDETLFSFINGQGQRFGKKTVALYKSIIDSLIDFQTKGGEGLDYSVCYPREQFDKQSMMWDLNYFKYHFLKLAQISFDEQALEDDFHKLSDFLLSADCNYFLYRDFQSRNIMLPDETPCFIDYQGGRKGALAYDPASLLFEGKINMPFDLREELLDYYIERINNKAGINTLDFRKYYYGYALIRLLQAHGAYGFRGLYEKKQLFIDSIPYGLQNIKWLLEKVNWPIQLKYLFNILEEMINSEKLQNQINENKKLTLTINSFSYRRGIPYDKTGNGGGFVFDCRGLKNPGRFEEYKELTGLDQPVIDFFHKYSKNDIEQFLDSVIKVIDYNIKSYIDSGYDNLMVSFGCTGGQHRSVYCAERLAEKLKDEKVIDIILEHKELSKK